jgi:hypothetical protein
MTTERAVAWSVLGAVTVFVLYQLHASLVLRDTTPVAGDLGGHLHEPAFLRDHLLPRWRLSGWSQDWFTGYPSLTFYFPLTSLLAVALDLLLPYNVAVKLVGASAVVALPLCAYAFGRLGGCDRTTSALFGALTLPLLLQPNLFGAGGTLEASAGGEYSYGLALALGLVVLGLARAGQRTGRHRALTAGLLAATVLLHVVPAFVVVLGIGIAALLRPAWAAVRWAVSVLAVGAALVGFWVVPFVLRTRFTAGPEYPKAGPILQWLFRWSMAPVYVVAVVGIVFAYRRFAATRDDTGVFLSAMALVSGLAFAVTPTGRVWNARFLALWLLWVSLLAAYGLAGLAEFVDRRRKATADASPHRRPRERPVPARLVVPLVVLLAVLVTWHSRLGPGLLTRTKGPITASARSFYEGYELKAARPEYEGLILTVQAVAREHGCGRAHVEWDTGSSSRIPLLWLIPYWTDGCISVTQGLYAQSSATSPYVDAANSRLSPKPENLTRRRPFDVAAGVEDLRILGVRYFVAALPETRQAADAVPGLRRVSETGQFEGRFWRIYEVSDVRVVEPLRYAPVVVPGVGDSRSTWERMADRWFDSGARREVVVATGGPANWLRRAQLPADPPRQPTPETTVSRVRTTHDRVSFDVSRPGTPVLVKVSYFPNWQASGADGPWRVTPNQMVVVPTEKTVTLRYGRTGVDHAGWLLSLVGVAGLVLLARRRSIDLPEPVEPAPQSMPPASSARKRRK